MDEEEKQLADLCKTKCHRVLGDNADQTWCNDEEGECCDVIDNIEMGLHAAKSKKQTWIYNLDDDYSVFIFIDDSIESLLKRISKLPDLLPAEARPAFIEKIMKTIPGCLQVDFEAENENVCNFTVRTSQEAEGWHRKVVDGVMLQGVVHPKFKKKK